MNELKKKLGISGDDALEEFEIDPCVYTLHQVSKNMQTEEMLKQALEHYVGDEYIGFLSCCSKKLLTYDLCYSACKKNGKNLKDVPAKYKDEIMCLVAIQSNSDALEFVPKEYRNYDLCLKAVSNPKGNSGLALRSVPTKLIMTEQGKHLCEIAVKINGMAIRYMPVDYLNDEMVVLAIRHSANKKDQILRDWPIGHVQDMFLSTDLVTLSLQLFPDSIRSAPPDYITFSACKLVLKENGMYLKYVPDRFIENDELIDIALNNTPLSLQYVPWNKRTAKRCFDAKNNDNQVKTEWFPGSVLSLWNQKHNEGTTIESSKLLLPLKIHLEISKHPRSISKNAIAVADKERMISRKIENLDDHKATFYYISDLHLEHQLTSWKNADNADVVIEQLKGKLLELINPIKKNKGFSMVLIAGDVTDYFEMSSIFYKELAKALGSIPVVMVLGNHELWSAKAYNQVDDLINNQKAVFNEAFPSNLSYLLENDVLIRYKDKAFYLIDEKTILDSKDEELSDVFDKCEFAILGGIGFSGRNPKFNAAVGLYSSALNKQEDIERSKHFKNVYDKVYKCAYDRKVIVLTHTQVEDWTSDPLNPKWIYVNGHTHTNGIIKKEDGTTDLFDNQVGYRPKKWHFNSFTFNAEYNPLEKYEEGIYEISRSDYLDFNRLKGITMVDFPYKGTIYMLKRAGFYMFFLKQNTLCLLNGAARETVNHPLQWYYDHMEEYSSKVATAFQPYQNALQEISNEIKLFHGSGERHGCIVDIDFYNHVYLNPIDGKVTPYYATDTEHVVPYSSIRTLLQDHCKLLLKYFDRSKSKNNLPILSEQGLVDKGSNAISVSEIVLDKSMYTPSRTMRSIQYVFDQNIIRIWRDGVLDLKNGNAIETDSNLQIAKNTTKKTQ